MLKFRNKLKTRLKTTHIIIHHSLSDWGNAEEIHKWHLEKDGGTWSGIGYHYVVLNGYASWNAYNTECSDNMEGIVQIGRPTLNQGAHARGFNAVSVGVCLIGNFDKYPTPEKQYDAAVRLVVDLMMEYDVPLANVVGHRETYTLLGKPVEKTCPGKEFSMEIFRQNVTALWVELDAKLKKAVEEIQQERREAEKLADKVEGVSYPIPTKEDGTLTSSEDYVAPPPVGWTPPPTSPGGDGQFDTPVEGGFTLFMQCLFNFIGRRGWRSDE